MEEELKKAWEEEVAGKVPAPSGGLLRTEEPHVEAAGSGRARTTRASAPSMSLLPPAVFIPAPPAAADAVAAAAVAASGEPGGAEPAVAIVESTASITQSTADPSVYRDAAATAESTDAIVESTAAAPRPGILPPRFSHRARARRQWIVDPAAVSSSFLASGSGAVASAAAAAYAASASASLVGSRRARRDAVVGADAALVCGGVRRGAPRVCSARAPPQRALAPRSALWRTDICNSP